MKITLSLSQVLLGLLSLLLTGGSVQAMDINVPAGATESVIQSDIQQVSASGGGNVNLPSGNWILNTPLLMYSNVALNGQGASTILQPPSTPYSNMLISYSAEGLTNVTINNLVLDGLIPRSAYYVGQNIPAPFSTGGIDIFAYTYPHTNILLSNLEVRNTSIGAIMGECNGITLKNCYFHDNGDGFSHNIYLRACSNMVLDHTKSDFSTVGDGLHVAGGGSGLTINKCEFIGNNGPGVVIQDGMPNETITNNLIEFNGGEGFETSGLNLAISQNRVDYNLGEGTNVINTNSGTLADCIGIGNTGDQFFTYEVTVGALMTSYSPNIYEAEDAEGATGPADTGDWLTTDAGFSGVGAVDFNTNHSANGSLTWPAVTAPTTGNYQLVFRYSNGSGARVPLALTINGVASGTPSFPSTGSWSTWSTVTIIKALAAGGNSVKVSVVPGSAAPVLDYLQVNAAIPAIPSAPTGMTATGVSPQQINLTWNAVSGCNYTVLRGSQTIATNLTGTTYSDSHLIFGGTSYSYTVQAVNAAGASVSSSAASAYTLMGIPAYASATGGYHQVTLQVLASAGATSFNLKRSTTSGGPYTTIANFPNTGNLTTTTIYSYYTDTTVTPGTPYYYVFTAVGPAGESGNSYEVTATPSFVPNGSFETPSVGTSSYQYNPSGGSWTFSGSSGIQSNGSAWQAANAPDGTQTAFLQGHPGSTLGSISQSVSFPAAGKYILSFQGAQRLGFLQPVQFSVDGVQVGGLLTPSSSSFAALTSALFTISSAGAHTITLSATDNSSDKSTMVDQVTITPADLSSQFNITGTGYVFNRATQTYGSTLTLTNIGSQSIAGPVYLELTGLPAQVGLANATGITGGIPYLLVSSTALAPGVPLQVPLKFTNKGTSPIGFQTHIYSGGY